MMLAHTGHGVTLVVTIVAPALLSLAVGVAAWRRTGPDPASRNRS